MREKPEIIKKTAGSLTTNAGMRYVYDTIEKLQLLKGYVLLGDAAKGVFDDAQIVTDKIEVGIPRRQYNDYVQAFLKEFGFVENEPEVWTKEFEGLPIIFRVIEDLPYFINPDTRFYDVDEYRIPNPFDEYWKIREAVGEAVAEEVKK
jgi:hypothetical protein